MEEHHSKDELIKRAGALREQAQRAWRLAFSFPVDGDKELLTRHARELEEQAEKIEHSAREPK